MQIDAPGMRGSERILHRGLSGDSACVNNASLAVRPVAAETTRPIAIPCKWRTHPMARKKETGAARKRTARKTAKARTVAARRSTTGKTPARKARSVVPRSAAGKTTRRRVAPRTAAAAKAGAHRGSAAGKTAKATPPRRGKAAAAARAKKKALSPEARKKLAGEHLRALLEQKKRRMTQMPAWQTIEHHDHAPRAAPHQPHAGGAAPAADPTQDSGQRGDS
jgi:hypothetical protein